MSQGTFDGYENLFRYHLSDQEYGIFSLDFSPKLDISEIGGNLGDRKCLAEQRKSFVEHPDAMQFLRISGQRVFQHPQAITPTTDRPGFKLPKWVCWQVIERKTQF
jgi:hypothetical protein